MSADGDIRPAGVCMTAGSPMSIALTLNAFASGRRIVDGADAEASVLQPQDGQTAGPAPSESMSPQHIGQVLP
jgi:hypothetical protein